MHMTKHRPKRNPVAASAVVLILILLMTVLMTIPVALADNGGGQPPKPDISITGIVLSDDEPLQDDEVTLTATVVSNMTLPMANVTIVFLVDMQPIGNATNLTLMPGTPQEASTVWVASTGTHVVTAMVYVMGMPLDESATSIEVFVEAKPVGDVPTLLYGLLAIAIVVLGMAIVPSILSRVRG